MVWKVSALAVSDSHCLLPVGRNQRSRGGSAVRGQRPHGRPEGAAQARAPGSAPSQGFPQTALVRPKLHCQLWRSPPAPVSIFRSPRKPATLCGRLCGRFVDGFVDGCRRPWAVLGVHLTVSAAPRVLSDLRTGREDLSNVPTQARGSGLREGPRHWTPRSWKEIGTDGWLVKT